MTILLSLLLSAHGAIPGEIRTYSTLRSVGVEWDIGEDPDLDTTVTVRFQREDEDRWHEAMPLVRTRANGEMLAGSILFLRPGTTYTVELSLSDSDGTAKTRIETIATRPYPRKPTNGRTFHVDPNANPGGDGSSESPFDAIDNAEVVAQPGDTFLLHAGDYGEGTTFDGGGDENAYVVWAAAGDGDVLLYGARIRTSHAWLEGLTILDQKYGLVTDRGPQNVVLHRNTFRNNIHGIIINHKDTAGWVVMDNTITGTNVVAEGSYAGEGILLGDTHDHVVMYNRISLVADGLSYPGRNVDIYGNDIFDTSDDGLELDHGLANVRAWGNRIHNAYHNGIAFQPQVGAPWYIVRNQITGFDESVFKFREGVDRNIFVHNTIVGWDWVMTNNGHEYMRSLSRNNLFLSVTGGKLFDFQNGSVGEFTDLDFDGFDWAGFQYPFKYNGVQHEDLASFVAATGQESQGIVIDTLSCIPDLDIPAAPPAPVPPQWMTLASGCPAIDAGQVLPNLSDTYLGGGPDLGAHETGSELQHYGPREDADDWEDTGDADTDTDTDTDITDHSSSGSDCNCDSSTGVHFTWIGLPAIFAVRRRRL